MQGRRWLVVALSFQYTGITQVIYTIRGKMYTGAYRSARNAGVASLRQRLRLRYNGGHAPHTPRSAVHHTLTIWPLLFHASRSIGLCPSTSARPASIMAFVSGNRHWKGAAVTSTDHSVEAGHANMCRRQQKCYYDKETAS